MKYVILRIEDTAQSAEGLPSLLEGAKTERLRQLAQAGAAGLIRSRARPLSLDRLQLQRSLFGLRAEDADAAPARCYAAASGVALAADETAWCCELVTEEKDRVLGTADGWMPTKESAILIEALNGALGADTRRWVVGDGAHHLLITTDDGLRADASAMPSAEALAGHPWRQHLPKGRAHAGLERLIEQAAAVLESHQVNRVRLDLGENPANGIWFWGSATAKPQRSFAERTGLSAALLGRGFALGGLAKALQVDWISGPSSFEESALRQAMKPLAAQVERRDLVAVNVRIGMADPVERLCAMERMDHLWLASLPEWLSAYGEWRLLCVLDDRATGTSPWVAIGAGLPQQAIASLDAEHLKAGALAFDDGVALFSWFMT